MNCLMYCRGRLNTVGLAGLRRNVRTHVLIIIKPACMCVAFKIFVCEYILRKISSSPACVWRHLEECVFSLDSNLQFSRFYKVIFENEESSYYFFVQSPGFHIVAFCYGFHSANVLFFSRVNYSTVLVIGVTDAACK